MIKDLPPAMKERRQKMAFEWSGWKIGFTGMGLILNTFVDLIP